MEFSLTDILSCIASGLAIFSVILWLNNKKELSRIKIEKIVAWGNNSSIKGNSNNIEINYWLDNIDSLLNDIKTNWNDISFYKDKVTEALKAIQRFMRMTAIQNTIFKNRLDTDWMIFQEIVNINNIKINEGITKMINDDSINTKRLEEDIKKI